MTLDKITQEAIALSEKDRAVLAASLLDTLPPPGGEMSDEEVDRREQEMDTGAVEPISHEELVKRVRAERGR